MAPRYQLIIASRDGIKRAHLVGTAGGFTMLSYSKEVNAAGLLRFSLRGDHEAIALLERGGQVTVMRSSPDLELAPYVDFTGIYRGGEWITDANDRETFTAYCEGALSLLAARPVGYPLKVAGKTIWADVPAESIMHALVASNFGPEATIANGRISDGVIPAIHVEPDLGRGAILSYEAQHRPVLEELQEAAAQGGLDFDLVKSGPAVWTFRIFPGQRGTDRRADVLFSRTFGNMMEPTYRDVRIGVPTRAIIAGQGEGDARLFVARSGPDWSPVDDVETWIDAGMGSTVALAAHGDAQLEQLRARPELSFRVLQTAGTAYGKHYGLGDLVRGQHRGVTRDYQVYGVTIGYAADGQEQIDVELKQR